MATVIINTRPATANDASYGITYRSEFVYHVTGRGVYNPHFPHRVTVWGNTGRLNRRPGEFNQNSGRRFGSGKYIGPDGMDTDDEFTVLVGSESSVITNNGTNTGTAASGQVYADETLSIGDVVILNYPDAGLSVPYVVTARPHANPVLIPMGN